MSVKERKERIRKYTELVEFTKPLSQRPAVLSIGEQKKISFARALICEPEVLFLDEPTESIDDKTEDLFISILKNFIVENKTVVFVSHDNYLINSILCDKIYFEDGEIKGKILLDDINQMDDYYEGDL